MRNILHRWRELSLPVIHIKHNSTEPDSTLRPELAGNRIKAVVKPLASEQLFEKTVNSAFTGTSLESFLRNNSLTRLVVVGLTTDHCVSTSVRAAANLGFQVLLVEDATATFDRTGFDGKYFTADQMHDVNIASLNGEFCSVLTTRQLTEQLG